MNTTEQWDFEGDLYCEKLGYSVPLRTNYKKHTIYINNGSELCASLRAGQYVFPGGYEIGYWTHDGAMICADCVKDNLESVIWSIRNDCNDCWQVAGIDVCYEPQTCEHCNNQIG